MLQTLATIAGHLVGSRRSRITRNRNVTQRQRWCEAPTHDWRSGGVTAGWWLSRDWASALLYATGPRWLPCRSGRRHPDGSIARHRPPPTARGREPVLRWAPTPPFVTPPFAAVADWHAAQPRICRPPVRNHESPANPQSRERQTHHRHHDGCRHVCRPQFPFYATGPGFCCSSFSILLPIHTQLEPVSHLNSNHPHNAFQEERQSKRKGRRNKECRRHRPSTSIHRGQRRPHRHAHKPNRREKAASWQCLRNGRAKTRRARYVVLFAELNRSR